MSEVELIVFLGCVVPLICFGASIFACELRIQHRDSDTRRYPRYGQSDEMRTKDKLKVKSKVKDNET